jgi:type II secretory pathway component PulF
MLLAYEAIDNAGKAQRDTIRAASASEAREKLRSRGLFVTTMREQADELSAVLATTVPAARRLPLKVLTQITRQVAMLLRAGSGIVPALSAIQRQIKRPAHAALLGSVVSDLEDGATLTDALRRHPTVFDPVYCAIVAAGEASGTMTEMFERLSVIVGKQRAMRKKILGALAYPSLLVFMCGNIFLVMLFFVLPRFAGMFEQLGVETPAVTRCLLETAGALQRYWPVLVGASICFGLLIAWATTKEAGKDWLSDVQLRLPFLGPLRSKLIQAQVFRTVGTLLESRVGVLETIELVRHSTRNKRFQALFALLENAVTCGGRLSTAFSDSGVVEPSICQAIHTGEDAGNLGMAMTFCADVLDETNEELITVALRLLEPAILILMGLVVGGVAISLFVPLFDMTSAIK